MHSSLKQRMIQSVGRMRKQDCIRCLGDQLHRAPSNKAVIGEASDVSSTSVVKKVSNSSNGQSNSGMQRPTKRLRA